MARELAALVIGLLVAAPLAAEVRFAQPIDCALNQDCVIQQFVDHDTTEGIADFACGIATYDGHKGTDFRVFPKDLERGVAVLAAADGVVLIAGRH